MRTTFRVSVGSALLLRRALALLALGAAWQRGWSCPRDLLNAGHGSWPNRAAGSPLSQMLSHIAGDVTDGDRGGRRVPRRGLHERSGRARWVWSVTGCSTIAPGRRCSARPATGADVDIDLSPRKKVEVGPLGAVGARSTRLLVEEDHQFAVVFVGDQSEQARVWRRPAAISWPTSATS